MNFLQQLILTIFLLSVSALGLWSQSSQVRFEHITSEQGLSENVVNCIFQDSRGFMWFGTNDGLNRYDGYDFKVYKPSPDNENTVNSNLIFAITEDKNGHIWFGTTGSGLNRFDPVSETFSYYTHDPDHEASLSNNQIISLLCDQKGRIWVGTRDGLDLILPGTSDLESPKIIRLKVANPRPSATVYDIVEDKSGNIWAGTRFGLFRCIVRDQEGNFEFEEVSLNNNPYPRPVRAIAIDKNGMLVVGTNIGLFYQTKQGSTAEFVQISEHTNQQSLVLDNEGKIWSGTYQGILCFKGAERNTLPELDAAFTVETDNPYSLNNNIIKSLFKDQSGIIWVGTTGGGVNKFDPERKEFFHFGRDFEVNGSRYKEIRSIFEDSNGNLWIGMDGGGLFWQDANHDSGKYDHFQALGTSASVFAIEEVIENDQHYIYIGSQDQPNLQKINISEGKISSPVIMPNVDGSVFCILQDQSETLWMGTYNRGLVRWIPNSDGSYQKTVFKVKEVDTSGLSSNIIRKVYEDSKGNIWIGTANGLNMIAADQSRLPNPIFKQFKNSKGDSTSLSNNYILDIYESASGQIWLATSGGGLNSLIFKEETQVAHFRRFLEKDGLANNTIKGIEEDIEGNIWLSTNRGLSKFDPEKEVFQNYTTNDGLQGAEFFEGASCKRANGELLFGGVNGFNAFYPGNINKSATIPRVVFTTLMVNNREVQPDVKIKGQLILSKAIYTSDEINLKYSQNDFSVEFAALHYAAPKQNRYAYKLDGYHEEWIEVNADKRSATFTNLPHGNYTLHVRASNGDQVWTTQAAELTININPPFWLTWYAYLFYVAFLLTALLLFRRYTVISVHEKHKLMLEHMEREKLEELNQMKLRFFTNISHELRTPLTLIISPLEYILEKGKTIAPEKLQQQYHYMYKNGKYLLRLVNQLLDFRKLDQGSLNLRVGRGNIVGFIQETTEPFQFVASKKDIRFGLCNPENSISSYFDPDVIEKIMYNLLSNAFKFTPSGGQINVEVLEKDPNIKSISGPFVEIRVEDDGIGISRNRLKRVFERFYKEDNNKENKDGAGIGLAFTKSLVELHHGTIDIESVKGKGACFIVRLPLSKKAYLSSEIDQNQLERFEATSDPLEYLVAEPISAVPSSVMDLNFVEPNEELPLLLFVDDNTDIRRFIIEGFQNDFRIIEAEHGEKGYEMAISSLPDIIVSDVMMPNMNGIELCESLKTNPLTSHIPIVLLTAKSAKEDEIEGLKTGADAYVVKPFKLDILRAQLVNIHLQREKLKQRFRQEIILEPEEVTVTSADEDFLKRAMSIIEDHMSDSEFNVEALVKEMYISRSKLYLKLKALTGQSSSEFIRTVRLKRAIQLLEKSDYTIKEIMFMTGFNTASYFSKCFKKQFGKVPSEYLKKKKEISASQLSE